MKRTRVVLLAVVIFAIALVAMLPASLAVSWLLPQADGLAVEDVRGSIWDGSAERLHWRGRDLGRLDWRLHPSALLRARLEADVRLQGSVRAQATVARAFSGLQIHDLQARLPAQWLDGVLASPGVQPQGEVELQVADAGFAAAGLSALHGRAIWHDAAVSGSAVAALGELHADFALADDGRVHGTVGDAGGPLSANGRFVVDVPHYRAEIALAARDPRIANALQWFGQVQPDGGRILLLEGPR